MSGGAVDDTVEKLRAENAALKQQFAAAIQEALQEIQALRKEVAEVHALRKEVAELRERLDQNSQNAAGPPSSDPPSAPTRRPKRRTGRKPGGQPGHDGHQRMMLPV